MMYGTTIIMTRSMTISGLPEICLRRVRVSGRREVTRNKNVEEKEEDVRGAGDRSHEDGAPNARSRGSLTCFEGG